MAKITQFHVPYLLSEVFDKAAALILNAVNRISASGLWPVDENVFSENYFIPSGKLNTSKGVINRDT
jgi:hypothetical protein